MAELRGAPLGEGAAEAAPTSPHATPRTAHRHASGPERFWARWPVRVALGVSLVISGAAHCTALPFGTPHGFEVKDVEGEAAIPIDMICAGRERRRRRRPRLRRAGEGEKEKELAVVALTRGRGGETRRRATPRRLRAGRAARLRVRRVVGRSERRRGARGGRRPGRRRAPGQGPRNPEAIVGAAGSVQADVVLVMLVVNAEVIRQNPVGARMGYLLRGIPQWEEFMSGTDIDPVRDTDWVLISGPSLINTARDVVLIHYSAPDTVVDRAVTIVTRKYDKGGPFDAGVRGVRASRAHADQAERILLRGQPHVLAVVPPTVAEKVARQLVQSRVPAHVRPGEALYLRLANPHHPMPEIPETISELRLRVVPRPDDGADVFIEGDAKDPEAASEAASVVRRIFRRHNDPFTSLLTHGVLDHVDVSAEGSLVKAHVLATRDHIETLVALVGGFLGVEPPGGGAPSPSASPPSAPAVRSGVLEDLLDSRAIMLARLTLFIALAAACSKPVDEPVSDFKPASGTPLAPGPTKLETEDLAPGRAARPRQGTPCTCSTPARSRAA